MALAVICYKRSSGFVREIFDTLPCSEVELYPNSLVVGIDHRERVASEAMHVPEGLWNSALRHDDRHLMERLWKKSPEVPVILSAAKTGMGVALDRVVKVREAQRIAKEKDRGIIPNDIPVSVLGVELESKSADIALRIGCPAFPSDGREAREHRRLLPNLRKNCCLGVIGNVVSRRKSSVRTPAFGVHPALRNDLAVKMCELLDQPDVLEQGGTATAGCQNVRVVRYGSAGCISKAFGLRHNEFSLSQVGFGTATRLHSSDRRHISATLVAFLKRAITMPAPLLPA